MLVMGPVLMVAGIGAIGVGAGICMCCKPKHTKGGNAASTEADQDNTLDSDVVSYYKTIIVCCH